jgi:hypothetical protein
MFVLHVLFAVAELHAAPHAVLFVGNSFTQYNDPYALDQSYAALVEEGLPEWDPLTVQRWARSGARLADHLESAIGETGLNTLLYGDDPAYAWDLIVLQDQSQIPGFPDTHSEWIESAAAAVSLAAIIDERGAAVRLFMTWAKREGDPINPDRFPDYPTMQGYLAEGYAAYAEAIIDAGYVAEVVPVGLGWQMIYDDHLAAGEDPLAGGALFSRLYAGDGSHPSRLGTYLAACVFYASLTGNSPEGLLWAPDTLTDTDRDALQAIAARLVTVPSGTGDTGTDTGVDTGSADDSGAPPDTDPPDDDTDDDGGPGGDTGGGADDTGAAKGDKSDGGCGCAAAPSAPFSALWLFGWLGLRRRVRRFDRRIAGRSPAA